MAVFDLPPRGHYFANDVGRLAGVSGDRIGSWARFRYIESNQPKRGEKRVYAYQDIAEAMVVHELWERRVTWDAIDAAIADAKAAFDSRWPLSTAATRGALKIPARKGRFTTMSGTEHMRRPPKRQRMERIVVLDTTEAGSHAGVFEDVDLVRIESDLARGGWAVRELPNLRHIEVDPDLLSGTPVIRGSRLSAEFVAGMATDDDEALEILREQYELSDEQIQDAVQWWSVVSRYEQAAA